MPVESLTSYQNKALCLLAAGYKLDEVVAETGIPKRTLSRWKTDPKFKILLQQAVAATYDAAVAELVSGSRDAAKKLKEIIDDPDVPSKNKISAISVLLNHAAKAKEALLESRLERVEESLDNENSFDLDETDTEQDTEA